MGAGGGALRPLVPRFGQKLAVCEALFALEFARARAAENFLELFQSYKPYRPTRIRALINRCVEREPGLTMRIALINLGLIGDVWGKMVTDAPDRDLRTQP